MSVSSDELSRLLAQARFQAALDTTFELQPTPGVPVSPSPVAAMTSDWLGS